ncbi:phage portal protein [Paenibacillus sp. HN-1]|uniref:XkdQ/YqbQ family protein n=1 Tax=Paenibacillus TaxID=44249 RepID=UPI001CA7E27F|nr:MULTISPECIES: phage portal protein [Paenibacillus]MBY9080991.1 phage portal protein [Paenibacillus sp. CGMCC 1.18879]MBY9084093.1 phage portal protein [Paenibacillus sinensis]
MSYEIVYKDKYYLRELIESISLKDSLDQISYQANIRLAVPASMPAIGPGETIRISGVPFQDSTWHPLLEPGVVWETSSSRSSRKTLDVTVYDRTIYLAKSEDEYLLPAGQTASQRLRKYSADWGIKLSSVPDTGTKLKKAVYRSQTIYKMISSDLQETVKAGGSMYIPRMTTAGLELFKIGSNKTVWVLEATEQVSRNRTLEGAVTKVKVLGTQDRASTKRTKKSGSNEEAPTPVLAIVTGETSKYGTLQKMVQDEDVKTAAAAKKLGNDWLTGIQESYSYSGIDINTLRAGDAVIIDGTELIVTSITHDLGDPGHMQLDAAPADYVKRRYFLNYG